EIRSLEKMLAKWKQGNARVMEALELIPDHKLPGAKLLLGLNQFIVHTVQTAINVKQWWLVKQQLYNEPNPQLASNILDKLVELAEQEIANAEGAIPYVE